MFGTNQRILFKILHGLARLNLVHFFHPGHFVPILPTLSSDIQCISIAFYIKNQAGKSKTMFRGNMDITSWHTAILRLVRGNYLQNFEAFSVTCMMYL